MNNLISPFIIKKEGIIVNNISRIYIKKPNKNHYAIYFVDEKMRIPLMLDRIFSYFQTCKPILHNLENPVNIPFLIPNGP